MAYKKGIPAEQIFAYTVFKGETVFIYWHHKQVMILKGKKAENFLSKIDGLNIDEAQLFMAKVTGNFKRGNE